MKRRRFGLSKRRWRPRPRHFLPLALVTLALVVGCGLPLGPFSAGSNSKVLKLKLGVASTPAPALPNAVMWVAKTLGFYEREGLDVDVVEVQGTPSVITALRSGDIDIGNISTDETIKLTATKTLDLRALHSPDSRQYFLIATRDNVPNVAGLAGKSFAISRPGSLDHLLSTRVLETQGIKADSLKFVAIGAPAARAQALAAGQIDATTISIGTWATIQRQAGVKVVMSQEDYYDALPVIQKVNVVLPATLKGKSEELRRFTTAILKVSRHLAENKQVWVDTMSKTRADISPQDLADLYENFHHSWAVNGIMNLTQYQQTADIYYSSDDFKDVPKIPVQEWADTSILDSVLKEIGVYDKFDDPGRPIP